MRPRRSVLGSTAFVHVMMIGTPAILCVNVSESTPNGTILESAGRRSKQLGRFLNATLKRLQVLVMLLADDL
ncbi:hypothetical protein V8E53_003042 [Lactarius tabidus]